ncbi:J domain-containing protein [Coralloluteibacterium stylophorae]|uniref:J domain-containing protein n=1 Tax=Coralloluteibacterium stylophorae TaxID=1776034 RepID=A0A8J7VU59_9GAMM|nr:J domain-containing protein [Coralloluteibacterium stylophorae]MBS7458540.1 J domain-containing protein [Coralloluteibacterium stylophorae]
MEVALALYRRPTLVPLARAQALPAGVEELLAIASGAARASATAADGVPPDQLRDAAKFFIQQILFAPGGDAWRTLGVEAGAAFARVRSNYLALMRWLHPDRHQPGAWDAVYVARVNAAWNQLRQQARRSTPEASVGAGEPVLALREM